MTVRPWQTQEAPAHAAPSSLSPPPPSPRARRCDPKCRRRFSRSDAGEASRRSSRWLRTSPPRSQPRSANPDRPSHTLRQRLARASAASGASFPASDFLGDESRTGTAPRFPHSPKRRGFSHPAFWSRWEMGRDPGFPAVGLPSWIKLARACHRRTGPSQPARPRPELVSLNR